MLQGPAQRCGEPLGVEAAAHVPRGFGDRGRRPLTSSSGVAAREGSALASSVPREVPTSSTKTWRPGAISSVRARSKPGPAAGPLPSEAQKQVPPARVQFTATMKACSRQAR